jgi:hypothetical protein
MLYEVRYLILTWPARMLLNYSLREKERGGDREREYSTVSVKDIITEFNCSSEEQVIPLVTKL